MWLSNVDGLSLMVWTVHSSLLCFYSKTLLIFNGEPSHLRLFSSPKWLLWSLHPTIYQVRTEIHILFLYSQIYIPKSHFNANLSTDYLMFSLILQKEQSASHPLVSALTSDVCLIEFSTKTGGRLGKMLYLCSFGLDTNEEKSLPTEHRSQPPLSNL